MDEHKQTMDYFMQELLTKEPHRQLKVVSQLPIICLALGPERTRETLLPWLKSEIEDTGNIQHSDEVLVAIAYNLGRCHEFIGPVLPPPSGARSPALRPRSTRLLRSAPLTTPRPTCTPPCTSTPGSDRPPWRARVPQLVPHVRVLLEPLQTLCIIDENAVREQAVVSLNEICKAMEPAQARAHAHTREHTRTYTHAHKHTHARAASPPPRFSCVAHTSPLPTDSAAPPPPPTRPPSPRPRPRSLSRRCATSLCRWRSASPR